MEINLQGSVVAKSRVELIDEHYITKWFKIIFEEGDLKEFGLFGDQLVPRQIFLKENIDKKFIDLLHSWNKIGYNIFCSPAPRIKIPEKGETSGILNVKLCRWFFADFDGDKNPWINVPENELLNVIRIKIQQVNVPPPTLIIKTSRAGYHFLWKINKGIAPEVWQPIENKLVYTVTGDWKTKECCKLLRPPGFRNTKRKPPVRCVFEEYNEENIYTVDEIECNLQKVPADFTSQTKVNAGGSKGNFSKVRPTWIEDEIKDEKLINPKEKGISPSGEVLVQAADPEHRDSYRTNINIFSGKWFDHGHEKHPELTKEFCGGFALSYFTLHKYGNLNLDSREKTKNDLIEKYGKRFLDWIIEVGIYKNEQREKYPPPEYPEKIARKLLRKYFTIPEGQPDAGEICLQYIDGKFYYGSEQVYIPVKDGYLNSLLWYELSDATMVKGKAKKLISFPANQRIIDNVIKSLKGLRNLRYLVVKNGSYKRDDDIGNIFWIKWNKNLPPAKNLIVCKNKIINYRTGEIYDLTLNLFCLSPLNVNYDESLEPPVRCHQFLDDNFENDEQIDEVLKRDAYLCLPTYLENVPAFFVMKGKTRSGKGTNIEFLRDILGRKNWEETSPLALGELYGLQKLIGILVGFVSDIEEDSITKKQKALMIERIKKMSSGIDYVDIRLVGGEWITIKLPIKLVFATTIMMTFTKSVAEIIARIQITEYKKQYSFDKERYPNALDPDPKCLEDMLKEKDAYFTHCIVKRGLKLLISKGFKPTKEWVANVEEIKTDSTPFEDFFIQCSEYAKDSIIQNDRFLLACNCWAKATNRIPKRELEELTYAKITKYIRRETDIETALDKRTRKGFVNNRKLTDYAIDLIKKHSSAEFYG